MSKKALANYYMNKRFKRNKTRTVNLVKAVNNVKKSVRKVQNSAELKMHDIEVTGTASSGSSFQLLTGIAEGDTAYTRTGDEIVATSLRGVLKLVTDTNRSHITCRVLIVRDLLSQGVAPFVTDVLNNDNITSLIMAPYRRSSRKRYKILYDRLMTFNTAAFEATNTYVPVERVKKIRIKMHSKIIYKGTGITIADAETNSIYVTVISDYSSDFPNYIFGSRLYFKDS